MKKLNLRLSDFPQGHIGTAAKKALMALTPQPVHSVITEYGTPLGYEMR